MGFRLLLLIVIFSCNVFFVRIDTVRSAQYVSADPVPWSGHWWPFVYGGIGTGLNYRGHPSPLEKYLLLTTGITSGSALDWYLENYYDPAADDWWGLCPAYARSAVVETYPVYPSVHNNIVFRVGDKKGLLALCHDSRDGVVYAPATAVNFHFWLLNYLRDQKKAIAMDLGAGDEVWYFPVYAYEMTTVRGRLTEDVTVKIFYAAHRSPDYRGTQEMEKGPFTYTLDLDAQGNIVGGQWTGDSSHPKNLSFPENPGPENPYLSPADCETIRTIARARDDELESQSSVPPRLFPGTHHLVLLDPDAYQIEGRIGDQVRLDMLRENRSIQAMYVTLTDADDVLIWEHTFEMSDDPEEVRFVLENPPYLLEFFQDNYEEDPNIYTITMDYEGNSQGAIPYIPGGGFWAGISITNPSVNPADEVMMVAEDENGRPLHTVLGPLSVGPGEKMMTHFDNLSLHPHEYFLTESMTLISDQPVNMVNLFAETEGPMGGFEGPVPLGNKIVIPDIYSNEPWDPQYMAGAVSNESLEAAETVFNWYAANGDFTGSFSSQIAAGGRVEVRPGYNPFLSIPGGGWMEIYCKDPVVMLSGYQYINSQENQANIIETLYALPVTDAKLYVQHVTLPTGPWHTRLTLINPNPQKNVVVIHPLRSDGNIFADMTVILNPNEKKVIPLSQNFGSAVSRSILEITGNAELCGYVSYESQAGDAAYLSLLTQDDFKTELLMPHATSNTDRWWTGIGICNPNSYPLTVFVVPHDKDGEPLSTVGDDLRLLSGAYTVFTIKQMFPDVVQDIAYLKIFPEPQGAGVIGGLYLYGNIETPDLKMRTQVSGGNM